MKIPYKETKIIVESLKAYHQILRNKEYRSPDELRMFNGLTPIIHSIEDATNDLKKYNEGQANNKLPIVEDDCEVCD